MKIPKTFNKMSKEEQESWLVKQLMEVHSREQELRKLLAKVRGGHRVQIRLDERPDEIQLKDVG